MTENSKEKVCAYRHIDIFFSCLLQPAFTIYANNQFFFLMFITFSRFTFFDTYDIINWFRIFSHKEVTYMSHDLRKRIHRIYGIVLSAVTVIAGICLILACYGIYTEGKAAGGQIYSRAIVAEAFAPIAVPVYLCLALVIGSFLLHLALPLEKKKPRTVADRQHRLEQLHAKTDLSACDSAVRDAIGKERSNRKMHTCISAALLGAATVVFLAYACNSSRWPEVAALSPVVLQATLVLAACLVIPAGYTIFTAYFCNRSMDKEIELMKQAAKLHPSPAPVAPVKADHKKLLLIARCAVVVLAVALLLYGYFTGGIADVMAKANAICTECVGLG